MIQPKDFPLGGKTFTLSKLPAIVGREIVAKYPLANMPKLGDYPQSEETMLKLMSYVGVQLPGRDEPLMLTTRALIDNHCAPAPGDKLAAWEVLVRLEYAMLEYNCSFFASGRASSFFEGLAQTAQAWISKTLTDLSGQLSQQGKPPSTN